MSWEKWIETIALQMDASCTIVLPMSRMYDVQQLDRSGSSLNGALPLVMWTDFCQQRLVRSSDSLSIDPSYYLYQSLAETRRDAKIVHDDQDGMMMDGHWQVEFSLVEREC